MTAPHIAPTISICIPVFNGSRYLPSAFQSLASQTFSDFEVIVANDGSTDDSEVVAQRLLLEHNFRGRVINGPNRGCEQARDIACRAASANFIATFDCDDLWHPQYLETMVGTLERHPRVGLAYCDFEEDYVDEGYVVRKSTTTPWIDRSLARQTDDVFVFPDGAFFPLILQGQVLFPPCTVYRKNVFDAVGGYSSLLPELKISLDWDFGLRVSRMFSIAYVDQPLLLKRRHGSNTSGNQFRTGLSDVKVIERLLEEDGLPRSHRNLAKARGATRALDAAYAGWRNEGEPKLARSLARLAFSWRPSLSAAKMLLLAWMPSFLLERHRRLKATQE